MAPSEVSAYLPPLDQCLEGGRQLLSWKLAFAALIDESPRVGTIALRQFLLHATTIEVLTGSLDPHPGPSARSRADFDTHTAAINLAPNANGKYDASQIKEDALWLSQHANIDEISALRLVVLEWQSRPTTKLLQGHSLEEIPAVGGGSKLKSSLLASISRQSTRQGLSGSGSFDSERSRKLRLLDIHHSERQFQYKTLEHVLFRSLCESSSENHEKPKRSVKASSDKDYHVRVAGERVYNAWNVDGTRSSTGKNWLVDAVTFLSLKVKSIFTGTGLYLDEGGIEELEMSWCKTQVLELIHLMHTILILAQNSLKLPRSDGFSAWFQLMDDVGFFGAFELPFSSLDSTYTYHLRSLATMASLALIDAPLALEILPQMSSMSSTEKVDGDASYISSVPCVENVTRILLNVAVRSLSPAQPVALAWGIILQDIRSYVASSQETRDLRQSQRAIDSFTPSQTSDSESNESSSGRPRPPPHRRTSFGSDNSQPLTFLEELVDAVLKIEQNEDIINFLARSAFQEQGAFTTMTDLALCFCRSFGSELNGKPGFKICLLLMDLLHVALDFVEYQPDLLQTALAIISGGRSHWERQCPTEDMGSFDPASVFLGNASLMDRIYGVALTRFPYESLPYLKLCQALAYAQSSTKHDKQPMTFILENLQTFTAVLLENETSYNLRGDEAMYIELASPLDALGIGQPLEQRRLPTSHSALGSSGNSTPKTFILPAGTPGRTMTEGKPFVVLFRFEYSGLKYMGLVLERAFEMRSNIRLAPSESILEASTDILGLLTALLRATSLNVTDDMSTSDRQSLARSILEEASDGLDRNRDIVSLVFDFFEDELYQEKSGPVQEGSTDLLIHCMQFTHALLAVLPARVWPFLGRSGLLGFDGLESRLASIVAVTEVTSGRFSFLASSAHLFEALVEDAVIHAVSRKSISNAVTRYGSAAPDSNGSGVTDSTMKKIIVQFERIMIDVFESSGNWRFTSFEERLDINTTICATFDRILSYCFDIDDNQDFSQKITGSLGPAAEYLLEVFLSQATNDLPIQPLLQKFHDGVNTPVSTLSVKGMLDWSLQTEAALKFTTRLIRTNAYLGRPSSRLEDQLFDSTPILARTFAANQRYRLPVVELLDTLVRGASHAHGQPPSLLAHLGQGTAKCFLDLLSNLDEPLDNPELSIATWKLLSAIVSQRQQWFAIYLLTGNTPKHSLKSQDSATSKESHVHPMLDVAAKKLCNIEQLDPLEAVNILEFVALSADFWPWVCQEIQGNSDLLNAFNIFLSNLKASAPTRGTKSTESEPYRVQMAAHISSILAIVVHRCNEINDNRFAKQLIPHLSYLVKNGVSTPTYNASLHSSLRKNFEARFPACKLSNFKRTTLSQTTLGRSFYYDLELANKILQHDSSWAAKSGQGFLDEFGRANQNLSFVEAQMNLFHGWKSLAVELSIALCNEPMIQSQMTQVICNCLNRNLENELPEFIFSKLAQSRASLAFVLLQRLINTPTANLESRSMLKPAWETLRDKASDLGVALTSPDSEYIRTLLKILYLALQAYASTFPKASKEKTNPERLTPEVTSVILEILRSCVARGFRSLITLLHDDVSKVLPEDLSLINAILRTCLRIPYIDQHTEQLVAHFADDNTARYASTLLSWADQLTVDRDPIYGELSIMFLTELSSVPALAEYIVTGGSLAQIGTTNLMNYFRRPGGSGPFDEPLRMYGIWTRGILPLALNVLGAIGAPIASDIATFVNQFRGQLERASSCLDPKPSASQRHAHAGYVTLSMASEAHSLALISGILEMFREAGASAGITPSEVVHIEWDRAAVKADLESRLQRRSTLRDDIVATDEREETLLRQKPTGSQAGAENRLEEKVVIELKAALALMVDVDQ